MLSRFRNMLVIICITLKVSEISATFQPYLNEATNKSSYSSWNTSTSLTHNLRGFDFSPYHPASSKNDDEDSYLPMPSSSDSEVSTNSGGDDDSKTIDMDMKIPQINFYSTFPNAIGVVGNGWLWFRELSAALGTPLPLWIFTLPTLIFGIGLIFMPDLTVLNLPFFYPNGDTDDPLAAFPPLLDFEFEDVQKVKNVVQKLLKPASGFF